MGSSNPTDPELEQLCNVGFTLVVSLLDEAHQPPRYTPQRLEELGVRRVNVPIEDFQAPSLAQLCELAELVESECMNGKILVHCQGGTGRTGTAAAAYWISKGIPFSEAVARVRGRGQAQLRPRSSLQLFRNLGLTAGRAGEQKKCQVASEPQRIPRYFTPGEFRGKPRALFTAAVLLFIVDEKERLLLLSRDKGQPHTFGREAGTYYVPSGSVEAGETILGAALREAREELGPDVALRPLGTVHAFTYVIPSIGYMVDICYLLAYEGGDITPGDDEAGSNFTWFGREELDHPDLQISVPTDQKWLLSRALQLYRLWQDEAPELQAGEGSRAFTWMPATTEAPVGPQWRQ